MGNVFSIIKKKNNNNFLDNNKGIVIYISFLENKKTFLLDYISVHKNSAYLIFKSVNLKKIRMNKVGKIILEVNTKNKTLFKDITIKDYNKIKNIPEITEEIILNKNQNIQKYQNILCFETRLQKELYEIIIRIDSKKLYLHSIMLKVPVERVFDI